MELPDKTPKYVVFDTKSIFHDDDERARTAPGHGYPAWTEHLLVPTFFRDDAELSVYLEGKARSGELPRVFALEEVKVEVSFNAKIG